MKWCDCSAKRKICLTTVIKGIVLRREAEMPHRATAIVFLEYACAGSERKALIYLFNFGESSVVGWFYLFIFKRVSG